MSEVAKLASVNRSTAYAYFKTRDNLINETTAWVSEKLFRAVFGSPPAAGSVRPEDDMLGLTERLVDFAMENPELCRVWLIQVLSLPDPSTDAFWNKYRRESARFAKTDLAQPEMDAEVFTVMQLAGAFLWPMTMHARTNESKWLYEQAHRYVRECVRQAMYGTVRPERFPELIKRMQLEQSKKDPLENDKNGEAGHKLTLTLRGDRLDLKTSENATRSLSLTLCEEDAAKLWKILDLAD